MNQGTNQEISPYTKLRALRNKTLETISEDKNQILVNKEDLINLLNENLDLEIYLQRIKRKNLLKKIESYKTKKCCFLCSIL